MPRSFTLALTAAASLACAPALAQSTLDAPRVGIMLSTGSTVFTQTDAATRFTNNRIGFGVSVRLTPIVGVEGEAGTSFGRVQSMLVPMPPEHHMPPEMRDARSPNFLDYNVNLVVSIPTGTSVTPFVTAGGGGLTLLKRPELAVTANENFLTVNVGGGVKWFNASGRWGLRGDYRVVSVGANGDASPFFGPRRRYAHRAYGGVSVGLGR